MSAHPTTSRARPARKPFWRTERFWRFTLPVLAAIAVVVAGILVYDAYYGSNGAPNAKSWGVTYGTPTPPKTVKLDPSVRGVVREFVDTAVARKNLQKAYAISGPHIRQGMTLKQFMSGNIAVVPFDVAGGVTTSMKVVQSYAKSARLQVVLGTPGRSVTNSPHTFFVDLVKRDGRWLVDAWVPRWTPPIPTVR